MSEDLDKIQAEIEGEFDTIHGYTPPTKFIPQSKHRLHYKRGWVTFEDEQEKEDFVYEVYVIARDILIKQHSKIFHGIEYIGCFIYKNHDELFIPRHLLLRARLRYLESKQ